ncbi:unnamed protein product [Didymodactylos carnosus]|uniref:Bromo domain-containing protein n=1 Tax=Didymodactylos carnosus TaxID=1234261 RepID=A0A813XB57_9BILA|nr:unnamed protein product [Didymodactylos carnosus]CAF0873402.1 unnamed protein product [Didymodactylos carnosus]CAF3534404.1 unnamed protein product [Didymodactylos carnosus]CAF3660592.1 unnamed protein product [Didymodactylos carnosus]
MNGEQSDNEPLDDTDEEDLHEDDEEENFQNNDLNNRLQLKTPLGDVLPSTYEGKTVEELFPAFKHNSVRISESVILKFSKIFGLGKPYHLPKPWKDVRKRRRVKDALFVTKENRDPSEQDEDKIKIREPIGEECGEDNEFLGPIPIFDEPTQEQLSKEDVNSSSEQSTAAKKSIPNWRIGPARYWYDNMGLDLDITKFDYGFKTKQYDQQQSQDENHQEKLNVSVENFLPINLVRWEDDIIFDSSSLREHFDLNSQKIRYCAWIPTSTYRSLASFQKNVFGKNVDYLESKTDETKYKNWYSIFPIDNYDLMYGDWEKDIIIDPEEMERVRDPPELILDENDEHLILEVPTDLNDHQKHSNRDQDKIDNPSKMNNKIHPKQDHRVRVTRTVLHSTGLLKANDDTGDEDETRRNENQTNQNNNRVTQTNDFWNLSNDEYYNPKLADAVVKNIGTLNLQHATPAVELHPLMFPTYLNATKLRQFHRPQLKKYSHLKDDGEYHPIESLQKIIEAKSLEREKERQAYGGGEMFYMRRLQDLSGTDSELVLAEYSEQYPPLMNRTGMATRLKNYYKKKPGKQDNPPQLEFGELSYAHTSPFLGDMAPGEVLQAFENHMYRAPIYLHESPVTDFLILRTKQHYYIRHIRNIFVVGQECPLIEVPGPNSKRANNFTRDFLQAYIYRLFWKSKDNPTRLKMEVVRKAFPQNAESSIRKRLKLCADFKRTGVHCNWWVLRNDFRIPTEEEIRQLVSPEHCCAFYSMQAAEQRLKDAGYGEKCLFVPADEEADDNETGKIEDEVKCAPWHTTKAYLDSLKGKCWLQLSGVADPTGTGEAFSFVRISAKPNAKEEAEVAQARKTVTGTDADLRRLHLKDAKKILNKFGVPDNVIRNLTRWQIIDVVRTMSTKLKDGSDGAAMAKFARGNRYSQVEYQEKYKDECRRIFELQNRSLTSTHLTSTDSESSGDSEVDEMRKNLESMLQPKNSAAGISSSTTTPTTSAVFNNLNADTTNMSEDDRAKERRDNDDGTNRKSIIRTFRDEHNREYQRVEIVKKPMVIEAYTRIRHTKDDAFIRQFFALDEAQREQLRRERRRIQEQLRRVKRQEKLQQSQQDKQSNIKSPEDNEDDDEYDTFEERNNNNDDNSHSKFFFDNNSSHATTSATLVTTIANGTIVSSASSNASNLHNNDSSDNYLSNVSLTTTTTNGVPDTQTIDQAAKTKRRKTEKDLKMKCGACGAVGHMRTNRECPFYPKTSSNTPMNPLALNSTTNNNDGSQHSAHNFDGEFNKQNNEEAVKIIDGTKLILSKNVIEKAEQATKTKHSSGKDSLLTRKSKKQKISKAAISSSDDGGTNDMDTFKELSPPPIVHISTIPFHPSTSPVTVRNESSWTTTTNHNSFASASPDVSLSNKSNRGKSLSTLHNTPVSTPTISPPSVHQPPLSSSSAIFETSFSFPPVKNDTIERTQSFGSIDYYSDRPTKKAQRRRIDPVVSFASLLETLLNELRELPEAGMFVTPVNARRFPEYYQSIKNPMDFQTIRQKIHSHTYKTRESFLSDMKQIVDNSRQFNGIDDTITRDAQFVMETCFQKFAAKEDKLMKLEKSINPLLDDDDLVAISYLFERIVTNHLMNVENSWPFLRPVSKVKIKDYHDIVKTPMDLETIRTNILKHSYRNRASFLHDVELIYKNSEQYNGSVNCYTNTALKILETCRQQLDMYDEQFVALEKNLEQQEKVMNTTNNTSLLLLDDEDDDYDDINPNQIESTSIISNNEQQRQNNSSMESTTIAMFCDQNSNESFNPEKLTSVTSPLETDQTGISLATFIGRDFSYDENMIVDDGNQTNNFISSTSIIEDNNPPSVKKENKSSRRGDTIKDVLGDISESDQSSDEDKEKKMLVSSLSVLQTDIFPLNETSSTKDPHQSHPKHRHHGQKHSKKRSLSKSRQNHVTSSLLNNADDALQLSESEED